MDAILTRLFLEAEPKAENIFLSSSEQVRADHISCSSLLFVFLSFINRICVTKQFQVIPAIYRPNDAGQHTLIQRLNPNIVSCKSSAWLGDFATTLAYHWNRYSNHLQKWILAKKLNFLNLDQGSLKVFLLHNEAPLL